jgi:hypothetical protein
MLFWIHDAGGAGRCVLHLLGDTRLSAGFNPVYNRFPSIDGIHCHRSTLCRGRADSRCFRDTNGGVACRPNCVPFLEVKKPKASANKSPTRVLKRGASPVFPPTYSGMLSWVGAVRQSFRVTR